MFYVSFVWICSVYGLCIQNYPARRYSLSENVSAMKPIVRKGDSTDHGGTVLEGFGHASLDGRPAAGVGHKVSCPKCGGSHAIVQGSNQYGLRGNR
ncbi:PAAR domain-containing protein [Trinickia sp.]|uniref:PAAR domain-containing protein n=1 Tax=Trinickia sp. TaxID=2571163 RepID=UPI003F7CD3D4